MNVAAAPIKFPTVTWGVPDNPKAVADAVAVDAVPVSAPINVVAVATPVIYTSSSTHKSVVLVTPVTVIPSPLVSNFLLLSQLIF